MQSFLTTHRQSFRALGAVLAVLVVGACSTAGHQPGGIDGDISFPDPVRSTMPEGHFVNLDNLRSVTPGMTKRQLYALLGTPHFNEGLFGVRKWNYLFKFHQRGGEGVLTCQYQVQFDQNSQAVAYDWKPASCVAVLDEPVVAVAPQPQPLPAEPLRLSADAMFEFDSAVLTAVGRRQLDAMLQRVSEASAVQNITVTGYADRLGGPVYNLDLSRQRAEAVSAYLVDGGIQPSVIHTEGRGSTHPLVECAPTSRALLIACLAPNRRVEISGVAR